MPLHSTLHRALFASLLVVPMSLLVACQSSLPARTVGTTPLHPTASAKALTQAPSRVPTIVVTLVNPSGVATFVRLDGTGQQLDELQAPTDIPIEQWLSLQARACAPSGRVLLSSQDLLLIHVNSQLIELPLPSTDLASPASMSTDGRFVSTPIDTKGSDVVLRLFELGDGAKLVKQSDIPLPAACSTDGQLWHPTEPLLAVLCASQAQVLIVDARTKTTKVLSAPNAAALLGWRGTPPQVLFSRRVDDGLHLVSSVAALSPTGPQDVYAGMAWAFLPESDSLIVGENRRPIHYSRLSLKTTERSIFPPVPPTPNNHTLVSSTANGDWVAFVDGEVGERRSLWITRVASGGSQLVWHDTEERHLTRAILCPAD
jgi:hypothetical protein